MKRHILLLAIIGSFSANADDICNDPNYSDRAQCNIDNEANIFNWVSDAEYRDNIVQVTYGPSSCGGMLLDGKFILTARHCTPAWSNWEHGNELVVYAGTERKGKEVYRGQASVYSADNDTRLIDSERNLYDGWQPQLKTIEKEANEALSVSTQLDIDRWIGDWAAETTP
ncbi:trypsin-like serine protease, partial [Vibrio parahaemolyticus]|nr:trypsin-like serine protease [Vibrio parahaemolyticus]